MAAMAPAFVASPLVAPATAALRAGPSSRSPLALFEIGAGGGTDAVAVATPHSLPLATVAAAATAGALAGTAGASSRRQRQRLQPRALRAAAVAEAPGKVGAEGAPPLSKPSFDLSGKHYIVTGGTQGLGLEIARQLKACGAAKIALMSRTRAKGEACAEELSSEGCQAIFVQADMADPASLEVAAAEAIEALGGHVDGLVNAAGTTERGNLLETTVEMFNKQFDINTRAPFLLTQALAKHMVDKGIRGSIVNISSLAAKGGAPFITAYSGSKAALNIHTQNNAAELAQYGIRVNAVNMGWTLTDNENALMVAKGGDDWLKSAEPELPMRRLMRPVDVACSVCFLLSPGAEMMTGSTVDLHPDTFLGLLSTKTVDSIAR
mmetsp:Transcript_143154/g.372978  ORF Transcript_143154/g.372978 Transcript_143154/m.372978 type:complete len:379 (-) Transcript_143154:64-1200(-)